MPPPQTAAGRARRRPPAARRRGSLAARDPCPRPAEPAHILPRAERRRSEFACEAILERRTFARVFRMQLWCWQKRRQMIVATRSRCDSAWQGRDFGGRTALGARLVWWSALPLLLAAPTAAAAQSVTPAVSPADETVTFSADQVTYDDAADIVTASGEVRMNREGNYLAADQVIWNRKTGQVFAQGS